MSVSRCFFLVLFLFRYGITDHDHHHHSTYIYFCSDRKKYNPFSRFARKVLVLYLYLSQWPCFLFDDVQVTRTREGNKDDSSKNKNNNHMLHVCMYVCPTSALFALYLHPVLYSPIKAGRSCSPPYGGHLYRNPTPKIHIPSFSSRE